jgi:endonuclease/exonuclease/phosphatase (EEP) superfamily protein YafD
VLKSNGIFCCDNLIAGTIDEKYTYVNESLGHFSCIDHIFMSEDFKCAVDVINVVDYGINFSDHRPLVAMLRIELLMF